MSSGRLSDLSRDLPRDLPSDLARDLPCPGSTATLGRARGRGFGNKPRNVDINSNDIYFDGAGQILSALLEEPLCKAPSGPPAQPCSDNSIFRRAPALRLVAVREAEGRIVMRPDTRGEGLGTDGSNGVVKENPRMEGGRPQSLFIGQKEQDGVRKGVAMKDGALLQPTNSSGAMQPTRSNGGAVVQHTDSSDCDWVIGREGLVRRGCWKLGVEQEEPGEACFLCGQPATEQCLWCRAAFYCSPDHQAVHRNKTRCLPARVEDIKGKGRGLVATRTIRARETILFEKSVLTGPPLISPPVCPGCLAPLRPPLLPCTRCRLPVCSPVCQESSNHREECKLLATNRVKVEVTDCEAPHPLYSFILPYRLLQLRVRDPAAWARVASLTDHLAERTGLVEWDVETKEVVNFLRRRCFLAKEFSDVDIHRAIGICAVNSVSLEPRRLFQGPSKGVVGRAVFPTFALLNHSCVSNSRFSVEATAEGEGQVRVEAKEEIKEGEEITVQYYSSVLGTHKRRRRLRAEWFFWCKCARCVEPHECGSHVSAVTCELCEKGYMLPRDPLDCYSDWLCDKCDFSLEVPDLERKIDQMEEELNELSSKKDLKRLEFFIREMQGRVLHPHHYLLLIARRNFLMICQKQLILELSRCSKKGQKEDVKEKWSARTEGMQEFSWVSKSLLGEDM